MGVMKGLEQYIDWEYKQRYSFFTCNCWHKSIRIIRIARELGIKAQLVFAIVYFRVRCIGNMLIIAPHFYSLIGGYKVDVAFDPDTEKRVCRNGDIKALVSLIL